MNPLKHTPQKVRLRHHKLLTPSSKTNPPRAKSNLTQEGQVKAQVAKRSRSGFEQRSMGFRGIKDGVKSRILSELHPKGKTRLSTSQRFIKGLSLSQCCLG